MSEQQDEEVNFDYESALDDMFDSDEIDWDGDEPTPGDDIEVDDDELPSNQEEEEDPDLNEEEEQDSDDGDDKTDDDDDPKKDDNPKDDESYESLKKEIEELYDDPAAGLKWMKIKRELKETKALVDQLQSGQIESEEVKTLKAKAARADEIEQEYQKAQERLRLIDYESTEEYNRLIVKPFNNIQEAAARIDKLNNLEEGTTIKAIRNDDPEVQDRMIDELSENLSRRHQGRVTALADEYLALQHNAKEIREQSETKMKEYQDKQVEVDRIRSEEQKAVFKSSVTKTFDKYLDKFPGFVDAEGNPTDTFTDLKNSASNYDFSDSNPDDKAFAAFSVVTLPKLLKELAGAQKEVASLKGTVRSLTGAKPGSPNSGPKKTPSGKKKGLDTKRYFAADDDDPDDRFAF